MKKQLTKDEIKAFDTNGFIMKKGLLHKKEVTKFNQFCGSLWAYNLVLDVPLINGVATLKTLHPESKDRYTHTLDDLVKKKSWNLFWTIKEEFLDIRHCHAITSHKSQGSTYREAFIDASDILSNPNEVEGLKCLYVAVSRASDTAHIFFK